MLLKCNPIREESSVVFEYVMGSLFTSFTHTGKFPQKSIESKRKVIVLWIIPHALNVRVVVIYKWERYSFCAMYSSQTGIYKKLRVRNKALTCYLTILVFSDQRREKLRIQTGSEVNLSSVCNFRRVMHLVFLGNYDVWNIDH